MTTLSNKILLRWAWPALALMMTLASGCSNMSYATIPGSLYDEGDFRFREVGSFEIELTENYWLFGFVKASDEKVAQAIIEQVRNQGGNGVRNLRYKVSQSFVDGCISFIACPITYSQQTVTLTGTVIQITGEQDLLTRGKAEDTAGNLSLQSLQDIADGNSNIVLPVANKP